MTYYFSDQRENDKRDNNPKYNTINSMTKNKSPLPIWHMIHFDILLIVRLFRMLPDANLGKYDRIIYTEFQKDIVGFSLKSG